jgi:hypothetical protein
MRLLLTVFVQEHQGGRKQDFRTSEVQKYQEVTRSTESTKKQSCNRTGWNLRMTNCNFIKERREKHEEQRKINLQQTTSISSWSTAVKLTPKTSSQQSILQVSVLLSTGASSIVVSPTSDTQTTISQTSSRKRDQPSAQLSSTQKKTSYLKI